MEINIIIEGILAGKGIRELEKNTGHHRDTIGRLIDDMVADIDGFNRYLQDERKISNDRIMKIWMNILRIKKFDNHVKEMIENFLGDKRDK